MKWAVLKYNASTAYSIGQLHGNIWIHSKHVWDASRMCVRCVCASTKPRNKASARL